MIKSVQAVYSEHILVASVSNQQPDIVLFCESDASNRVRVTSYVDRILRVASNTTLSTALIGNRIAAIIREVRLHNARRALLVQRRRVPCLLDSCAGRCVVGREVVLLSDNVEGAVVARRSDGNVRDEASTDRLIERVPGTIGGPACVARNKATSACYGRSRFDRSGGFGYCAADS